MVDIIIFMTNSTSLSRIELLIMLSIGNEQCHGYQIMQRVEDISDGRQKLGAGTLYAGIKRLVQSGLLIEEESLRTARRRYYSLTPSGKASADDKLDSYASLVKWATLHGWAN